MKNLKNLKRLRSQVQRAQESSAMRNHSEDLDGVSESTIRKGGEIRKRGGKR